MRSSVIRREPTAQELQSPDAFAGALTEWSEFPLLTREQTLARHAVCLDCPHRSEGRAGIGFCENVNRDCRSHKIWMRAEYCPLRKWPDID